MGIWVHAWDNSDVTWFGYRTCSSDVEKDGSWGGDYMGLAIFSSKSPRNNGAWCDNYFATSKANFICESYI